MRHPPLEAGHADRGQRALDAAVDLASAAPMWSGPKATSSNTVGLKSWSSGSWKTSPTIGADAADRRAVDDGARRSGPSRGVGSRMPLRWSSSVLLPAPFGPDEGHLLAGARSRGRCRCSASKPSG